VVYSKEGRRDDQKTSSAIAIEMADGGSLEGVTISNISIRNARAPIFIRLQNQVTHNQTKMKSWMRSVMISDVQAFGAILTSSITGIPDRALEDVTLRNIRIQTDEPGQAEWTQNAVPEREHGYPAETMFGRLPTFGIYCRHVNGLTLSDVDLVSKQNDPRPMLICDTVKKLSLRNITGTPPSRGAETIRLTDASDVAVSGNYPSAKTNVFVQVEGDKSSEISFFANGLHRAKTSVRLGAGVPTGAVRVDGKELA